MSPVARGLPRGGVAGQGGRWLRPLLVSQEQGRGETVQRRHLPTLPSIARPRGGAWGVLREWLLQGFQTDAAAARGGHNDFSLAQGLREPSLYA